MSIIIPSKQIYSKDIDMIRDNIVLGTNGEQTVVSKPKKNFVSFSWQPYTYQSQRLFLQNLTTFTANETPTNPSITSTNDYSSGFLRGKNLNININSDQYIDINTLRLNISVKYVYSKAVESDWGTANGKKTSDTYNRKITSIPITTTEVEHVLVPGYGHVPNFPMYVTITYSGPSKSIKISLKLPLSYWGQYTGDDLYDCAFITNLQIDIYSDVYDLTQKETVNYGINNKSINLSSNELFQSDTKYNGEPIFNYLSKGVIESYRNGKEISTIRTSIGEYYEDDGELAISTKNRVVSNVDWAIVANDTIKSAPNSHGKIVYEVPVEASIIDAWYNNIGMANLSAGTYQIITKANTSNTYGRLQLNTLVHGSDSHPNELLFSPDLGLNSSVIFTINERQIVHLHYCSDENRQENLPTFNFEFIIKNLTGIIKMVFDIGDNVIPQMYGADGKDHPMSRYPDGTPKVFRVCGTKIYYDGAVWQELSLQEV